VPMTASEDSDAHISRGSHDLDSVRGRMTPFLSTSGGFHTASALVRQPTILRATETWECSPQLH
jgi:hypothetical protein